MQLHCGVLVPVAHAQQMVIFVRHAERADGGPAGAWAAPADPCCRLRAGRAENLAKMLADAGVKVYATEFHHAGHGQAARVETRPENRPLPPTIWRARARWTDHRAMSA